IKVSITGGFSNVLDKKIEQQLKDDKLEVDVAIFQTLQDFVRWKAEDHLLNYKPQGIPGLPDQRDATYRAAQAVRALHRSGRQRWRSSIGRAPDRKSGEPDLASR